jgi:molybdate transport repressor ModE-like protein
MLDTQKLIMLRAIAAEGSIAAAARRLGYTRSAVSQQLSALERAAGTPLIIRTPTHATLTPTGARLVEHTERILVELRAAEATLHHEAGTVAGLLRVGVPFSNGPAIMRGALTAARRRFPELEIRLTAITDESGPEELRRGRLDIVILSRFGTEPRVDGAGLREWELSKDPLKLCVPDGHRLADSGACSIPDLQNEPWIISPSTTLGKLISALCTAHGFRPTIAATVDDLATALGLVGAGWGITIAPELTPTRSGESMRRIDLTGLDVVRRSILMVRDGEHLSPRIAAVVDAIHTTIGSTVRPG